MADFEYAKTTTRSAKVTCWQTLLVILDLDATH